MNSYQRFIGHLTTITKHKLKVGQLCFRCGLYWQGICHDLSKYSWVEFSSGVKYFQGNRSPIDKQKEVEGYARGWLHHKGRNKHHWEYWMDFTYGGGLGPVEMPKQYLVEMYCDRIAASMIYQKENYRDDSALQYFLRGRKVTTMHPKTDEALYELLKMTADHGLDKTIDYIKKEVLK